MGGRGRRLLAAVAVLSAVGARGLATAAESTPAAPSAALNGVVAVVDTGINPYHAVFRDRSARAQRYPGTYLPGYPKGVPALRLSLDAKDFKSALERDCERVWGKVKPGQLYWIPGTKIVGAVTFRPTQAATACPGQPYSSILDTYSHGTMTASRAVATGYGACPDCRVVAVQAIDGFGITNMEEAELASEHGLDFVRANAGWIDASSNSWGATLPYDPSGKSGLFSASPRLARTVESLAQVMPTFLASGNGAANLSAPPPRSTLGYGHMTPSALAVGGVDSGRVLSWPNLPVHLAADACHNYAASHTSTTLSTPTTGGGTSAATPYVAAGAVRELVEARRLLGDRFTGVRGGVVARGPAGRVRSGPLADGVLTVAEWRRLFLTTATARPVAEPTDGPACPDAVVPWSSIPSGFPEFLSIGYGVIDTPARTLAAAVLAGTEPLPDRTATDGYFAARDAAATAQYAAYTAVP